MGMRFTSFLLAMMIAAPALAQQRAVPSTARDRARPSYMLGLEQMRIEAWDEAAKAFETSVDIDPTFESAYYMLGRTNMARKRYAEATSAYEKCRSLYEQQNARQYSDANERQRQRDNRLRDIDEAIRTYQGSTNPSQNTLNAIRQLENDKRLTQEAISRSHSTMTLGLGVPAYVSLALGSAYFRSGNMAGAEKEYKAAIETDPKAAEAHNNLAVVYMETGRLDDADKSLKTAEKVGFRVNPQLKEEIKNRRKAGTN